jgi:methylated-DNA-[protein]-cysteine S-methyltransferase
MGINPQHDTETGVIPAPFGTLVLVASSVSLLSIDITADANRLILPTSSLLRQAAKQFEAFFQNPQTPFSLPLAPVGTSFQKQVWRLMAAIPPGSVKTYGQLAAELASSPRAVAGACRANPFPIVIPCHRVVAADGLGGYCGAITGPMLAVKGWLLQHEGYEFA